MKRGIVTFVVLFVVLFVITLFIFPMISSIYISEQAWNTYKAYISAFIELFFVMGLSVWSIKKFKIRYETEQITMKSFLFKLLIAIFVGILLFIIFRLVRDAVYWIYIGATDDFSICKQLTRMGKTQFWNEVFLVALIPAFCEELFYRYVGQSLLQNSSKLVIILLTSLLFGVAHIASGIETAVCAFSLGIVLMSFFIKYRQFYMICVIHFIYNFCEMFFSYQYYWISDVIYISSRASCGEDSIFFGIIYLAIAILIVAFAIGIGLFISYLVKKRGNKRILN